MTLQEKFDQAREESQQLPEKPSNEVLLQLYGLYKQATQGDAVGNGPENPFDFVAKAKFQAWYALREKDKDAAMTDYIALVEKLKA